MRTGAASTDERTAFGAALREAMLGVSNVKVAEHVGLTPDAVAKWVRGDAEPSPLTVFAVEAFLDLQPGELSRHLGYLPVGATASVVAAIEADPRLTVEARRVLVAAYRAGRRG